MFVDESERYNRQSIIPDWDQSKLNSAKVLILGIGATGSYVATNLALTGVGELILVDFDTIEESNLNRQLLFRNQDIGKNKAVVAGERLQELNPVIKISVHSKNMESLPRKFTRGLTLIASCLDNFPGRRWANSLALREKVPMVSGGMYAFLGNVQTVLPYESPCFECQPLITQDKLSQACTPLGEARKDMVEEKEEVKLPSISPISSIIGGLMTQEIIKLLISVGKPINNYLFYDGLHNAFTELELSRNPNCPICGEKYKLKEAEVVAFKGEKVSEFKNRIAFAFGMADPMITLRGKILSPDDTMKCKTGDKILVLDERLAAPIALKIRFKRR